MPEANQRHGEARIVRRKRSECGEGEEGCQEGKVETLLCEDQAEIDQANVAQQNINKGMANAADRSQAALAQAKKKVEDQESVVDSIEKNLKSVAKISRTSLSGQLLRRLPAPRCRLTRSRPSCSFGERSTHHVLLFWHRRSYVPHYHARLSKQEKFDNKMNRTRLCGKRSTLSTPRWSKGAAALRPT